MNISPLHSRALFRLVLFMLALTISSTIGTAHAQRVRLTISAAASMQDALTEIGRNYERETRGLSLDLNFGSSGTLQTQIEQGAPVDLFIAAADRNMDELQRQNLIDPATRRNLAGNTLVLIVPRNSRLPIRRFRDVLSSEVRHIAIGGPTVPSGQRAQEVFTRLGIWSQVQAKAVRGRDVRAVLTQVELGNVEAGVVYGTDAIASRRVRAVAVAPYTMHKPIVYPVAVIRASRHPAQARAFAAYLRTPAARAVLRRFNFIVP